MTLETVKVFGKFLLTLWLKNIRTFRIYEQSNLINTITMKKEFWLEKWKNNQTGFHKDFTHPLLVKYIEELGIQKGDTVFVPLCGKSLDMLWLNNQGYQVLGVELSELAVEQFFSENNLIYKKSTINNFDVYQYENITLYVGDFFDLNNALVSKIKAVYDRAAFIALPDDLVKSYVDKMFNIIPSETHYLLITLEFIKTSGPKGPPFSSSDDKVKQLFNKYSSIKVLQEEDILSREQKFKEQGCEYVFERVHLIKS
jgi:thiopurine S-methyltransferase